MIGAAFAQGVVGPSEFVDSGILDGKVDIELREGLVGLPHQCMLNGAKMVCSPVAVSLALTTAVRKVVSEKAFRI